MVMAYPEAQLGTFRSGGDKPIVALDIDGTLGDYHAHFLWFAERYFGWSFPPADEVNPGMRLSEFMRIPPSIATGGGARLPVRRPLLVAVLSVRQSLPSDHPDGRSLSLDLYYPAVYAA